MKSKKGSFKSIDEYIGTFPENVQKIMEQLRATILAAVEREGGIALVTADHGNAEQMLDADGRPQTAHTSNPVPLLVTDHDVSLLEGGELSDLMPTAISLLGLAKPLQMTGKNLMVEGQ